MTAPTVFRCPICDRLYRIVPAGVTGIKEAYLDKAASVARVLVGGVWRSACEVCAHARHGADVPPSGA
jgi:hypothetical protein